MEKISEELKQEMLSHSALASDHPYNEGTV